MLKDEMICPLCGEMMVKHIIKEGARFHVHSYDINGMSCSTKDCEDNHGYGKCVPKESDPLYGLSHQERLKKLFEIDFKKAFEDAGDNAHKTLVKQMKNNPDAISALYE